MASIYYKLSEADSKVFMLKVPFGSALKTASATNCEAAS
jgi:hypothetical protein